MGGAGQFAGCDVPEEDTTDTSVLEPLINRTVFTVNYERTNPNTGRKEIVNPIEVVANQLNMYIRKGDFENASVMAKLIPDGETKYDLTKAYAWALGGVFPAGRCQRRGEWRRARHTFDTICRSSERNAIVMHLAVVGNTGRKPNGGNDAGTPEHGGCRDVDLKAVVDIPLRGIRD